ncbi:MAG: hypothetical protein NVS4B7_20690 [Ktedonobacteraceae bacterium]
MFDTNSRYYTLPTATIDIPNGDGSTSTVRYVQRRIIPPPDDGITVIEHTVTQGDRIDNITFRYLGDPLAFWLVCDANNVMQPSDLTDTIGRVIQIALPRL